MIPIYLDPAHVRIALVGRGQLIARRLAWLARGEVRPDVWSDETFDASPTSSHKVFSRLPNPDELARYHAVWVAGLSEAESRALAAGARQAGVLINVEDVPALCDFHTPALVRRGRLTLAAGTGGASPAVARAARERLEQAFPESWSGALDEISDARAALRNRGAVFEELVADAQARLHRHGLV